MVLDVLGNIVVDGGRQRQVEETVRLVSPGQRQDVCVEFGEGIFIGIFPTDVCVPAEEGRQPICLRILHLCTRFENIYTCMDFTVVLQKYRLNSYH